MRTILGTMLLAWSLAATTQSGAEPLHKGKTPEQWTKVLKQGDAAARIQAAGVLAEICKEDEPDTKVVVPALVEALKDKEGKVRGFAAEALGYVGSDARAAIPDLINLLKDRDDEVRSRAAFALGGFGAEAKAAVPALIGLLADPDDGVRASAAAGLGEIGAPAKEAVPALTKALKDADDDVRLNAAAALGSLKADAKEAVAGLAWISHQFLARGRLLWHNRFAHNLLRHTEKTIPCRHTVTHRS